MKATTHPIKDQRKEVVIGFILFIVGVLLLYDAYDRRNNEKPLLMKLITPF